MQRRPEIHSIFTQNGVWLGDFPSAEFAEVFQRLIEQLQNRGRSTQNEPTLDQYDADRLGV
jgi:hypothetical protein